jgi:hypothetical protein
MKYTFEDLTVGQYQQFLIEGDKLTPARAAEILTGKKKSQLTLKEIKTIRIESLNPPEKVTWNRLVLMGDTLYGRVDMNSLSFGEFVDLLDYAKDLNKNLVEVVALMYRPIVNLTFWNRVKLGIAQRLANRNAAPKRMMKILESLQYELEEYDPVKCDLRHKVIKQMPAHTAHWTVSFFLNFSQQLMIDSLKSLSQTVAETLKKTTDQPTKKG